MYYRIKYNDKHEIISYIIESREFVGFRELKNENILNWVNRHGIYLLKNNELYFTANSELTPTKQFYANYINLIDNFKILLRNDKLNSIL